MSQVKKRNKKTHCDSWHLLIDGTNFFIFALVFFMRKIQSDECFNHFIFVCKRNQLFHYRWEIDVQCYIKPTGPLKVCRNFSEKLTFWNSIRQIRAKMNNINAISIFPCWRFKILSLCKINPEYCDYYFARQIKL